MGSVGEDHAVSDQGVAGEVVGGYGENLADGDGESIAVGMGGVVEGRWGGES